jgi:hypothetical protein
VQQSQGNGQPLRVGEQPQRGGLGSHH